MANKNTRKEDVSLLLLLATTFLPGNDKFNIIRIIIVTLLCFVCRSNQTKSYAGRIGKQIVCLWIGSIFLAMCSVAIVEGGFNTSVILHEISRVFFYSLVIYACVHIRINIKKLFVYCAFILCLHFIIQLTQYLRLGTFNNFIETYYLLGNAENVHYQLATKEYYSFRSGSIFINPNVYVCYPYISLAVFLEYYRRTNAVIPLFLIIIAFISILLTGSRMGLLSFIIILLWYRFYGKRRSLKSRHSRSFAKYLLVSCFLILFVFNVKELLSFFSEMRAFNIGEAYEGSGSSKLIGFIYYLTHSNPLYWLTGSLGTRELAVQIDMEFGYVFAWFGIIGLIWYFKLLNVVYRNNKSEFNVLSSVTTIGILITAIGASSILNMSVFPYICAVSLTQTTR